MSKRSDLARISRLFPLMRFTLRISNAPIRLRGRFIARILSTRCAQRIVRASRSADTQRQAIPFTVSTHLREQFFGEAEGFVVHSSSSRSCCGNLSSSYTKLTNRLLNRQPWNSGSFDSSARANLSWESSRQFTLAPSAESLNDVSRRADAVLRHFITPHAIASATTEQQHVMIFAHGLFLSEMMFALQRCDEPELKFVKSSTYTNTGWSRVEITLPSPPALTPSPLPTTVPHHVASGHALASTGSLPPPLDEGAPLPRMKIRVLATNQVEHLEGLVRQKGGIGSMAHDDRQRGIGEFFSGDKLG